MTEILHVTDLDEITRRYLADERVAHADRPWVAMGMIASVDGATAIEGRSSGLGGPPDTAVFRALRAAADVVLVGASTVRAESYRAPSLPDELVDWRRASGRSPVPRVAIVSRSLRLAMTDSLAASHPLVLTTSSAPPATREALAESAEVIVAGGERVEPGAALRALSDRGVGAVVLEGGPTLNGQMLTAGVVDEICITIAPRVIGGDSARVVVGPPMQRSTAPARVIVAEGHLLVRHLLLT